MNPKFSIIIPVYNVAPYLRECLDSVLAQTYTDWEAICVDDGSTDGSGEILDKYAAHDSRFHVFHRANAGAANTRNWAKQLAVGEWIVFVDSDDVISSAMLSAFYSNCQGVDLVCARCCQYREDLLSCTFVKGILCSPCDYWREAWEHNACWAKAYKLELLNDYDFPENVAFEDERFTCKVLFSQQRISFIREGLYWYRLRSGGITAAPNSLYKIWTQYESLRMQENLFRSKGIDEFADEARRSSMELIELLLGYRNEINQDDMRELLKDLHSNFKLGDLPYLSHRLMYFQVYPIISRIIYPYFRLLASVRHNGSVIKAAKKIVLKLVRSLTLSLKMK